MPYASDKQRGWMHVNEPEIAKRWDKESKHMAEKMRSVYKENYEGKSFQVVTDEKQFFVAVPEVSGKYHGPFKDIWKAKEAAKDIIDDTKGLKMEDKKQMTGSEKGGDDTAFDPHATEPQRLSTSEPGKAADEIERRMKRLEAKKGADKEKIEHLEAELKQYKKLDPDDISGKQVKIKQEIENLKMAQEKL